MDFSDRFVDGLWTEVDARLAGDLSPDLRVALLTWKIRYGTASMEIATGSDPRTNLLDMAIFITAARWALQQPEKADILLRAGQGLPQHFAHSEQLIWQLVEETLTSEQTDLLRELVDRWLATNPSGVDIATARFRNLEGVVPADFRRDRSSRGLLASVRRWLGEVNTSLLFGERMLFYLERTPRILTQQTDLTLAQIAHDFPIATVQPDFPALTGYLEALPEKLIGNLQTTALLGEGGWPEVRATLGSTQELIGSSQQLVESANELTLSLQTTLESYRLLSEKNPATPTEPLDYSLMLSQVVTALSSLQASVDGVNELLAVDQDGTNRIDTLAAEVEERTERMLDRIVHRILLVLAAAFVGVAALLLLARGLFRRPTSAPTNLED
jgi:hypothetical protein